MKYALWLIAFLFMLFPASLNAQDVQMRLNPDTGEYELITPEDIEREKKEAQQTLSHEERANLFYTQCMERPREYLNDEEREMFCGCVASAVAKTMTPEQLDDMQGNGAAAREQWTRKLMFADGFCAAYPLRSMVRRDCIATPTVKNANMTCNCIANEMWNFLTLYGSEKVGQHLQYNIGDYDIDVVMLLLDQSTYRSKLKRKTTVCVAKHE